MSKNELLPITKRRVFDLVRQAGVDISDWKNYKGGIKKEASNPKYCYEWAFVQPKKVVVLNLWYSKIIEKDGELFQEFNMRKDAEYFGNIPNKSVWSRRALSMDLAIKTAVNDKLKVRVIICHGHILRERKTDAKASKVNKRMLDPIPWTITKYDNSTGDCRLVRGLHTINVVDQFNIQDESKGTPEKKEVKSKVFSRDSKVRSNVLIRSNGKCEYCDKVGFELKDGRVYLETHHIIPLSENGKDRESNVAALCPDHHREAHYGIHKEEIKNILVHKIKTVYQYKV